MNIKLMTKNLFYFYIKLYFIFNESVNVINTVLLLFYFPFSILFINLFIQILFIIYSKYSIIA